MIENYAPVITGDEIDFEYCGYYTQTYTATDSLETLIPTEISLIY